MDSCMGKKFHVDTVVSIDDDEGKSRAWHHREERGPNGIMMVTKLY